MRIFTVIAFLLLCTSAFAQNTKRITFDEACTLALTNSKQLAISKEKMKEARARLSQAKDRSTPEVKASATYLRLNTPQVKMDGTSSGGSSDGSPLAAFANLHDIGLLQLSLSQPIFAGFKIHHAKVMEQYLTDAATYDTATTHSKVLLNTAKAVYQYYELQQTSKAINENIKQAEQRVAEFRNLEAQGILSRNDRLKAELQLNNIELARTEINNNLALAEFSLNVLLGFDDNTSIELDTTGMFVKAPVTTWEECLQHGLSSRSELRSAQLKVNASETGVHIAKASRYPTLGLSAGYINAYVPNVVTVNNALNAGLSLQYNLSNVFHSKHQVQEASAKYREAEIQQQITNDEIRKEIKKNFLGYQKSLEKITLAQQAVEQAQENYTINQNKYKAGLVTLSDYLEADVTLLQAQINFATAEAESMVAYYELLESTGSINQQ